MIDGEIFVGKVKEYFSFLGDEFGFTLSDVTINGNYYYSLEYIDRAKAVSIYYENIGDYLTVKVCLLENGQMPHYDDATKNIYLGDLNTAIFPAVGQDVVIANKELFQRFETNDGLEETLLKAAMELHLDLKYFDRLRFDREGIHLI